MLREVIRLTVLALSIYRLAVMTSKGTVQSLSILGNMIRYEGKFVTGELAVSAEATSRTLLTRSFA
jgi:hypothetical protein